jgi:hypothetical protein
VDESVLALAKYKWSNPLNVFYPARPHNVALAHSYSSLLIDNRSRLIDGRPDPNEPKHSRYAPLFSLLLTMLANDFVAVTFGMCPKGWYGNSANSIS